MSATDRPDEEVPGLQRERTLLAWSRTSLALVVAVALLVRVVGPPWFRPSHLPAVTVLLLTGGLVLAADRRHQRSGEPAGARALGLVAVAVVTLGVVSLVALVADVGSPAP